MSGSSHLLRGQFTRMSTPESSSSPLPTWASLVPPFLSWSADLYLCLESLSCLKAHQGSEGSCMPQLTISAGSGSISMRTKHNGSEQGQHRHKHEHEDTGWLGKKTPYTWEHLWAHTFSCIHFFFTENILIFLYA